MPGVYQAPNQLNTVFIEISSVFEYTFNQINQGPENWANDLCFSESTDQDSETFNWQEDTIGLTQGIRHRPPLLNNMLGGQATIPVYKWEKGFTVDIHEAKQDRLGQIMDRAKRLGESAAYLKRDLVLQALRLGNTSAYLMYDGQNYFANAHPKGGTTFDNEQTGALDKTFFQALRTIMRRFPSDAGASRPLNIVLDTLVVPPDLEYTAMELMNNSAIAVASSAGVFGSVENVIKGMARVIVAPELTDTNDWYGLYTRGFKPFCHIQKRGFSPFMLVERGLSNDATEAFLQEYFEVMGWTYENVFPTRPEFGIHSAN